MGANDGRREAHLLNFWARVLFAKIRGICGRIFLDREKPGGRGIELRRGNGWGRMEPIIMK
jgi:hypothetical protein